MTRPNQLTLEESRRHFGQMPEDPRLAPFKPRPQTWNQNIINFLELKNRIQKSITTQNPEMMTDRIRSFPFCLFFFPPHRSTTKPPWQKSAHPAIVHFRYSNPICAVHLPHKSSKCSLISPLSRWIKWPPFASHLAFQPWIQLCKSSPQIEALPEACLNCSDCCSPPLRFIYVQHVDHRIISHLSHVGLICSF